MTRAEEQVWAAVNAIYAAYLAGDRDAIDRHIAPGKPGTAG